EEALLPLLVAKRQAAAAFQEQLEEHPEAVWATIGALDEAVARGELNVDVANRIKQSYLEAAGAARDFRDSLPTGAPLGDRPPSWAYPGGAPWPGETAPPARPTTPAKPKDNPDIITRDEGLPLGLGIAPGDFNASAVYDVYGREWVWKKSKNRWYRLGAGKAFGGPVDPDHIYPVVELGEPEMYETAGGKKYLLPAESGKVTPLGTSISAPLKAPIPDAGSGLRGNGAYDHGPVRRSAVMPDQGGQRYSAVMPDQPTGERWSAVMPDRELTAEIRALRGDLVSTVRFLARSVNPAAGEELAPVLRDIERNTRIADYGPSARSVRSKGMAYA